MSGGWVYGNFINSKRFLGCSNEFRIHEPKTGLESDVIPETVGQFTGLNDKNGKEIYDGDILNVDGVYLKVWYSEKEACYFLGNLILSASASHREIIGNVFENADLVKL